MSIAKAKKGFVPVYNTALLGLTGQRWWETGETKDMILAASFGGILVGDMLLLKDDMKKALPIFALSHLGLGTYFTMDNGWQASDALTAIPVGIISWSIINRNRRHIRQNPVFMAYLTVLSFMLWRVLGYAFNDKASGERRLAALTGASMFFAVDVMVGLSALHKVDLSNEIWTIYPASLLALAVSNRV